MIRDSTYEIYTQIGNDMYENSKNRKSRKRFHEERVPIPNINCTQTVIMCPEKREVPYNRLN